LAEGFEQAGVLPLPTNTSPTPKNEGIRDVIGMHHHVRLAVLYVRLLTMTAGRFFELGLAGERERYQYDLAESKAS